MNKTHSLARRLVIVGILFIPCVFVFLFHTARLNSGEIVYDWDGTFEFDATKPFKIDLGRGSERYGLDSVSIDENGDAVIYRGRSGPVVNQFWNCAAIGLSEEHLRAVASSIVQHHLPQLQKSYDRGAKDGIQWILWIRQGKRQKVTYFDNQFPNEIQDFAKSLDQILTSAGMENLDWVETSENPYDETLWQALTASDASRRL